MLMPEIQIATIRKADRIHRFPAKMSPRLALSFIMDSTSKNSRRRIRFHDPMCGSGTTALVARSYGLSVSATDAMYPASVITKAKLHLLSSGTLTEMSEFVDTLSFSSVNNPQRLWPNWRIWYTPRVLRCLEEIAKGISYVRKEAYFPHLLTAFFQTTWDTSSADRNVIVPTRSNFSTRMPRWSPRGVVNIFRHRLARIIGAQQALEDLGFDMRKPSVYQSDALDGRSWPDERLDLILTSPPYGCGVDYERAFRLQMRIWSSFLSRELRPELIGRRNNLRDGSDSLPSGELTSSWYIRLSKMEHESLQRFLQYVHDMRRFLQISRAKLSKSGRLCLVMGNPQIGKKPVPLVRIVQGLASEEGFRLEASPSYDRIKTRIQNFRLRSATSHIKTEYLLSFLPN